MKKVCYFNQSSVHYRSSIYKLMDNELSCDFYFGDSRPGNIKAFENESLKNFKGYLKNIYIGPFYWQKGALSLLRKPYKYILTTGDTYCLSTWVMLFLSKIYRKKIFLWTHGAYGNEKWFKRQIVKLRSRTAAGLFLYGNWAKQVLMKYGVDEKKLHLIFNSLSYEEHLKLRTETKCSDIFHQHFNNTNSNVIFIGRLTAVKELHLILEAVAQCKSKGDIYNVTFIGEGPEISRLQILAKKLDIEDNVWFYGACYDEVRIGDFLYNADVCVSPGNVGLTAIHAMAFGLPVITHNDFCTQMPEYEAIEDGVTGAFFHKGDVSDLSIVLSTWLNQANNRENIRKSCYKVIDERYNPIKQIETLNKILH